MAYYTKVLLPDEQVRVVGKLHWMIFLRAWIFFVFAIAAGAVALYLRSPAAEQTPGSYGPEVAWGVGAVFLLFWLVSLASAWLRKITTEIVVTDRRVIFKEGFIRRRTVEMNMAKVETVDVVQSIWGRILGYGTVLIRGTGSSYAPLQTIANPLALRTAIVVQ